MAVSVHRQRKDQNNSFKYAKFRLDKFSTISVHPNIVLKLDLLLSLTSLGIPTVIGTLLFCV